MTDMVKGFNIAMQALEQGDSKVRGFKSAGAKVDIMKEFRLRNVFLGDGNKNEM